MFPAVNRNFAGGQAAIDRLKSDRIRYNKDLPKQAVPGLPR
jgi:hypothetical protein